MNPRRRQSSGVRPVRGHGATHEGWGFAIRDVRYEPELRQPVHHHERTTATLVLDGSLEEMVGSTREWALPLSAVFKPAGTEHANRIGPEGAATLQLSFEPEFLDASGTGVPPSEWAWAHGGSVARRFLDLLTTWRAARPDETEIEGRVYDLLGHLWSGGVGTGPAARRGGATPTWLRATVEEVDDTFQSPRRVRDLAAAAGVHPVALARAHRRHFGWSISDRIKARRVGAAAALLGHSDVPLSSVAYQTGFADQSHLTRVFKAETGLTPGRYRALLGD